MSSTTAMISFRSRDDDKTLLVLLIGVGLSVTLHASVLLWAAFKPVAVHDTNRPVELQIVQLEPPPPPTPEPPKPVEPPKPKMKPPPIKVAEVKPQPVEPPPPIEEAKEPPKPVPLIVGISMSSTTSAGGFAAPVGNTAYGKMEKAVAPSEVKPYSAPRYVPPGAADREPEVAREFKGAYPDEARRAGIEGVVQLRIVVDDEGRVVDVKMLNGPGYGLNEAAREWIKKFVFKPAVKGGEAVSTTIVFNFRFLLD